MWMKPNARGGLLLELVMHDYRSKISDMMHRNGNCINLYFNMHVEELELSLIHEIIMCLGGSIVSSKIKFLAGRYPCFELSVVCLENDTIDRYFEEFKYHRATHEISA